MSADARTGGVGYPDGASAIEARMISIVRAAKSKADRVDAWNQEQSRKGK